MSTGWIVLGVIVILVLFAFAAYNRLVALGQRVNQAFADIDVQLKQRHDLVPNLVETVKGYAAHERGTLDDVVKARSAAISAQGPGQVAAAENQLSGALGKLIALSSDIAANIGAYSCFPTTCGVEPLMAMAELPGPYDFRAYSCVARGVATHTCTMAPYRGVSRPVITLANERLMDKAAAAFGLDTGKPNPMTV